MTQAIPTIAELAELVAQQQIEISRLRQAVQALSPLDTGPTPSVVARGGETDSASPAGGSASRRNFFKVAGATAVGAAGAVLLSPESADAAGPDPYPQYVLDTGDTVTGKLAVSGATSLAQATEIGDGTNALTLFANGAAGVDVGSKSGRRVRMQAQTRWDSDDAGLLGSGFNILKPATVWRQTGENHKGALIEFQQWLEAGPHESGVAANHPGRTFTVPRADFYPIGWITAHYDSPNPVDTIHQHMNFETCKADLATKITRFQISWGEDVTLCSFVNTNVRVIHSNKVLSFGSSGQVAAVYTEATGRLDYTGHPVSFQPGQLQVAGTPVAPTSFVRKTADEVVTNLAQVQNDNHLSLGLAANATYTFTAFLNWSSPATVDLRMAWRVPAGAVIVWSPDSLGTTAQASTGEPKKTVAGTEEVSLGGVGPGVRIAAAMTGIVRTGDTAGDMHLVWSQNKASATPSVMYADSYLQLFRVS